ncbi:MAG TPA: hypothetical protein PLT95_08570 [Agitococcus sp.]|nr:hypothetical protein [Agitococcus sp.]
MTSAAVFINKAPIIFQKIKADFALLQNFHQKCLNFGLSADQLPTKHQQMAFCLLGDYERERIVLEIKPKWCNLQERNLTPTIKIDDSNTAILRYLLVITDVAIEQILSTHDLFDSVDLENVQLLAEDNTLISFKKDVEAAWATPITYQCWISEKVSALKILPDQIFGFSEYLYINQSHTQAVMEFDLTCDTGEITFLLLSLGKIYKATVTFTLIKDAHQKGKFNNKGAYHAN